jgi:hypothetical protein
MMVLMGFPIFPYLGFLELWALIISLSLALEVSGGNPMIDDLPYSNVCLFLEMDLKLEAH